MQLLQGTLLHNATLVLSARRRCTGIPIYQVRIHGKDLKAKAVLVIKEHNDDFSSKWVIAVPTVKADTGILYSLIPLVFDSAANCLHRRGSIINEAN